MNHSICEVPVHNIQTISQESLDALPELPMTDSLQIQNTVNDKVDLLKISGDSWQLKQEQGKNLLDFNRVSISNFTYDDATGTTYEPFQPAMPSPDYPSEIKSVSGNVKSCGWNLFDKDTMVLSNSTLDGDIFTRPPQTYDNIVGMPYWTPEKSQDYTIFVDVLTDLPRGTISVSSDDRFYFEKQRVLLSIGKNFVHTRTRDDFSNVFLGSVWINGGKIDNAVKFKFAIFKGHITDLPYDRYRGSQITLPELRAIRDNDGNVVARDYLYVDRKAKKAWVERNVYEKIFNGLETINTYKNGLYFSDVNHHAVTHSLCSHFKNSGSTVVIKGMFSSYLNKYAFHFFLDDTPEDFKAFLTEQYNNDNPVKLLYALESPIIEELPYSDYLLTTAQYQTNIRFVDLDENLHPTIEVQVKCLGNREIQNG